MFISTHSPRAGRTQNIFTIIFPPPNFNSLAPCGANHGMFYTGLHKPRFQLTRPVRGEPQETARYFSATRISTHSPRAGRTPLRYEPDGIFTTFQLTRPVRGEPLSSTPRQRAGRANFNSLAPCGANQKSLPNSRRTPTFQLTRPVRGEPLRSSIRSVRLKFQLTRPVRGEPYVYDYESGLMSISTHSPRAGRTQTGGKSAWHTKHFNSLAPCGANPKWGTLARAR